MTRLCLEIRYWRRILPVFNLDGRFIVHRASSENRCRHVGAHDGFGENDRKHWEAITYGVTLSSSMWRTIRRLLHADELCCVMFTHSTTDLDGSRHCGHADQPRTGVLVAEAGGRLSQMQSCGLWSPREGQLPRCPCRNSSRLIYERVPNYYRTRYRCLKRSSVRVLKWSKAADALTVVLPVMSRLHLPAMSLFCGHFHLFAILIIKIVQ